MYYIMIKMYSTLISARAEAYKEEGNYEYKKKNFKKATVIGFHVSKV